MDSNFTSAWFYTVKQAAFRCCLLARYSILFVALAKSCQNLPHESCPSNANHVLNFLLFEKKTHCHTFSLQWENFSINITMFTFNKAVLVVLRKLLRIVTYLEKHLQQWPTGCVKHPDLAVLEFAIEMGKENLKSSSKVKVIKHLT